MTAYKRHLLDRIRLGNSYGCAFAFVWADMKLLCSSQGARRKAVWGPKRQFAAALLCVLTFAPNAMAAARSNHGDPRPAVRKAQAGKPNANAVHKKMDRTLTNRADGLLTQAGTSKVIVTFKPGYRIPAALKVLREAAR